MFIYFSEKKFVYFTLDYDYRNILYFLIAMVSAKNCSIVSQVPPKCEHNIIKSNQIFIIIYFKK